MAGGFGAFARRVRGMKPARAVVPHKMSRNTQYPDAAELFLVERLNRELLRTAKELLLAAFGRRDWAADSVDDMAFVSCEPGGVFVREVDRAAGMVNDFQAGRLADWSMMAIGERYIADKDGSRRKEIMARWAAEFVEKCRSVKREMRGKVAAMIYDGYNRGRTLANLAADVRETLKKDCANRAELIARTETGKLNAAVNEAQAADAGIEYYEWGAVMDGRTRPTHQRMDGRFCRYGRDDTYYTYEDGRMVEHAREDASECVHGMPGTDFQCRCCALPYFPELEADYVRPETVGNGVVQERTGYVAPTGRRTLPEMVEEAKRPEPKAGDAILPAMIIMIDAVKAFAPIKSNPVAPCPKTLTDEELAARLGGGDMTGGSCVSLALAYCGQRAGYDVLDFRGGSSTSFFQMSSTMRKLLQLEGVVSVTETGKHVKAGYNLLRQMREGVEYMLGTGEHCAIVKKEGGRYYYFEMQNRDSERNGWRPFTKYTLRKRFGSPKTMNRKNPGQSYLIETEGLRAHPNLPDLLGYINTPEGERMKGVRGSMK